MTETVSKSKRIAKNTLMLYFRQILIMLVSLFTVRVVLNVLGAEDYGIYNVVAGVVVLFSFVNTAMATSTQRFLNYSLGEKNFENTRRVYSASLVIHFVISLIFILFAESIGLWFVKCKLNVPYERHFASVLVYQFTIATTVTSIIRVPYTAVIIAHEKMNFFALVSVLESCLKLLMAFLLSVGKFDKLILYGILLFLVSLITLLIYKIYCNVRFLAARFVRIYDKELFRHLLSFSGWSLFGSAANVCNIQGINIILNLFTNVAVNAAMGIANQVNTAVFSFVSNFQVAFNPQIVKSYAEKDTEYFKLLIFRTSKISFFLLYFIFLPLYLNTEFVLKLWLKAVPDYSVKFVQLVLTWSLVDVFNNPMYTAIQANGDIKNYNVLVSAFKFIPLPLIILCFEFGFSVYWVLYVEIICSVLIDMWRVFYCQKKIDIKVLDFLFKVFLPSMYIFMVTFPLLYFVVNILPNSGRFFVSCIGSVVLNLVSFYFIGLTKTERLGIKKAFIKRISHKKEVL